MAPMIAEAIAHPSPAPLALRPYQEAALASIRDAVSDGHRRLAMQMPTGTGKTVTFAALASEYASRGARVLILAHREELLDQAAGVLRATLCNGTSVGVVQADRDHHGADIVIASVATLRQPARIARVLDTGPFGLVIVDEAHHAAAESYQAVLRGVGALDDAGPVLLGVTATLFRGDRKGLAPTFQRVVYSAELLDMIQAGYLSDLRALQVQLAVDLDAIGIVDGDYAQGELSDALTRADAPGHVARALAEHARGRVTLAFTPTIALAEATAAACEGEGFHAEIVTGTTPPDERRRLFEAVRQGEIDVLVNVGVATEGTDLPRVDCIAIARPTRSKTLYVQMLGRGTRLHPQKSDCLLLDFVGATARHDLMTAAVLFETAPEELADSLCEAVARRASLDAERRDGELRAQEVALFERMRSRIAWTAIERHFAVAVDDATLTLSPCAGGYDVLLLRRDMPPATLASSLATLELAQGVAEGWIRSDRRHAKLARPGAAWRAQEASEAQRCFLVRRGGWRDGMTRGEAGHVITATVARWALERAGRL